MQDIRFVRYQNEGMKRVLSEQYFFTSLYSSVSMVTEGYINRMDYFGGVVGGALNWVTAVEKSVEDGKPFFSSEGIKTLFEDGFLEKYDELLFETVHYKSRFHVVCQTRDKLDQLIDLVHSLKDGDDKGLEESELSKIMNLGLLMQDTEELVRPYRMQLLKQGVGDHLSLRVGGL